MLKTRVIPCLLLRNGGLVKTIKFKNPTYIGDPINAVRIFNEKEVDELVFLDIAATVSGTGPDFSMLEDIASEAFIPLGYGGGISNLVQIKALYSLGVEKVILNSAAIETPDIVDEAANLAGSSGVVVSMDVHRNWLGMTTVVGRSGRKVCMKDPVVHAVEMEKRGAGELFVNSVDRDGSMTGYDLKLIEDISSNVSIPIIACGGAGSLQDFRHAVNHGASAVAAGSMFVFHGKHKAVLITYPTHEELEELFADE